jgi:hypothetical protein
MKPFLLAAIALAALGAPSVAEPLAGCFTRTYDRAHLAKHPDQTVTAVKLKLIATNNRYDFILAFKVRGSNKTLRTEGFCMPDERGRAGLNCRVECDGGGIFVSHRANDLMMHLDHIRVVGSCDESVIDSGQDLSGGKDDREFRLDRVSDAMCVGMVP